LERCCGGCRRVQGRGAPHERGALINADDPAEQDVTRGPTRTHSCMGHGDCVAFWNLTQFGAGPIYVLERKGSKQTSPDFYHHGDDGGKRNDDDYASASTVIRTRMKVTTCMGFIFISSIQIKSTLFAINAAVLGN
ncbi:unnamed protein product, partial [Prunus brigantina]